MIFRRRKRDKATVWAVVHYDAYERATIHGIWESERDAEREAARLGGQDSNTWAEPYDFHPRGVSS